MSYRVALTEAETEELAHLLKTVKDPKLYRRLLVISLRNKNYSFKEICIILQVSHKSATEWVKLFLDQKFEGLLTLHYPQHRTSKLDLHLPKLKEYTEAHPEKGITEIYRFVSDHLNIKVDQSWLYRYLIQHKLLKKK